MKQVINFFRFSIRTVPTAGTATRGTVQLAIFINTRGYLTLDTKPHCISVHVLVHGRPFTLIIMLFRYKVWQVICQVLIIIVLGNVCQCVRAAVAIRISDTGAGFIPISVSHENGKALLT